MNIEEVEQFFYWNNSEENRKITEETNIEKLRVLENRNFVMKEKITRRNSINIKHEDMKFFYHQQKLEKMQVNRRRQRVLYKYSNGRGVRGRETLSPKKTEKRS